MTRYDPCYTRAKKIREDLNEACDLYGKVQDILIKEHHDLYLKVREAFDKIIDIETRADEHAHQIMVTCENRGDF